MKIVTFRQNPDAKKLNAQYCIGALISDDKILDLTSLISDKELTASELLDFFDLNQSFLEKAQSIIARNDKSSSVIVSGQDVEIVAPIPRPNKIICIGLNYRDHVEESGAAIPQSPVIFSKFATCMIGVDHAIVLPKESMQVDYEAELAFVIGRQAKNVKKETAMNYVFGYTNFNDVSARDFQFSDGQWQRGKSCDTFAPMGKFIATTDEIIDPHNLQIQFRLNGQTLQNSNTSELIFKIPELIEFLSKVITLEPGDVIATGTPPGVGFARKPPIFLKDGDLAEVEIEGLGILSNPVAAQ